MTYGTLQNQEVRLCPECGAPIAGRPDKKFCSNRCRNIFWNRRFRPMKEVRMKLTTALFHNYSILGTLIDKGQTSIKLSDIEAMGFDSNAVTGCYSNRQSGGDFGCYDIRYVQTATKIFSIHKTKSSPAPDETEDDMWSGILD